jgi:ABC-type multidrug transport system ATPase subunit
MHSHVNNKSDDDAALWISILTCHDRIAASLRRLEEISLGADREKRGMRRGSVAVAAGTAPPPVRRSVVRLGYLRSSVVVVLVVLALGRDPNPVWSVRAESDHSDDYYEDHEGQAQVHVRGRASNAGRTESEVQKQDPSLLRLAELIEPSLVVSEEDKNDDDDDATKSGLVFDLAVDATSASSRDDGSAVRGVDGSTGRHPMPRALLRASGVLRNGRVCGVLGPSGSGKTTLLSSLLVGSALSSTASSVATRSTTGLNRTGHIWLYRAGSKVGNANDDEDGENAGRATPKSRRNLKRGRRIVLSPLHPSQVAFLQQQDDFFELLTVRETLELAAFFELPAVDAHQRSRRVQSLLESLGLAGVASNWIGNAYNPHRGRLSGGERRRLSVALELVTPKALLVADEPTTGLDSTLSVQVMKLIRNLTIVNQIPTVVSLHQPRSSIFHEHLDDCILMASGGRVCYSGSAKGAVPYFADLGYKCPPATNPAEFLVDLVSVDPENATQAAVDRERIDALVDAFGSSSRRKRETSNTKRQTSTGVVLLRDDHDALEDVVGTCPSAVATGPARWVQLLGALLRRSWRQNIRNRTVNLFRAVASAGNAYLLSLIFPTVRGPNVRANSVADRVALLSFGAINQCMMAYMKTAELFSKERPVVQREQVREQYSVLAYLLAKIGGELLLDATFAAIFTTTLKCCTGIRITWKKLTAVYSLLTVAGGSLGFAIGSWAASDQLGTTVGIPILVILMVVGVINPSGVDPSKPAPKVVQWIKRVSPFASCIEALCLGEYPGMKFARDDIQGFGWFRRVLNLPRMGGLALVRDGDQVVDALGLTGLTFEGSMKHLSVLVLGNLMLSWLGLLYHQQRSTRGSPNVNGHAANCSIGKELSSPHPQQGQTNRPPTSSNGGSTAQIVGKIRIRY